MANITINGNSISVSGVHTKGDIVIRNGSVIIDGVTVASNLSGIVKIKWDGPLASLRTDSSVECGDVANNVDAGGSVSCGRVDGSIDAGGSVTVAGTVSGDIDAGGSVTVSGKVGGSIDAGGSVRTG